MTTSLELLAQPHPEAVLVIVQEALKPGVSIDDLVVGQYQLRGDGKINQPVYIDSDAYNDPTWAYRGSVEMTINRVDLQDAMGHLGLKFRVPQDTFTSSELVGKIMSVLLLYFDPSDYIQETHTIVGVGTMFTLRAAPDSPRWKGEVSIYVHR